MATDTDRALIGHLLRRSGFGASGAEIDAAAAAGYEATLDGLFAPVDDPGADATPPPSFTDPASGAGASLSTAQREALNAERARQSDDLVAWWLARMTAAARPWTEKRSFFWHGHFATSIQKVNSAALMLAQNQTLRSLGGGDFKTLMRTVFTDPAMMLWLDASGSTAAAPNENLARESMELFTLGVGAFSEQDVRQAALALTGWRLNRVSGLATFVPRAHAPGPETILGSTAAFDVDSFNTLLTSRPANPRFLASRVWFRLGGGTTSPPADVLSRLTAAYGPRRDLTALARALFSDPVFTAAPASPAEPGPGSARYALVKQPVEYVVGVLRALRITPPADGSGRDAQVLRTALNGLGQLPFHPPNVGGWPAGRLWLTTAAVQARMDFARWAVGAGDISAVADAATASRIDTVAHLLGVDAFSDRTRSALSDVVANPVALVEFALLSPEYLVN